jgi:hypothetical protein
MYTIVLPPTSQRDSRGFACDGGMEEPLEEPLFSLEPWGGRKEKALVLQYYKPPPWAERLSLRNRWYASFHEYDYRQEISFFRLLPTKLDLPPK